MYFMVQPLAFTTIIKVKIQWYTVQIGLCTVQSLKMHKNA